MLNEQQFEGKWTEIKGGIRNLWGKLTDDELEQVKGNLMEVTGLVEAKYGETKEEIRQKLHSLMDSFDNDTDKNITPDAASFERSPLGVRTSEESQKQDTDRRPMSSERKAFDGKTYEATTNGESNYSGANPGRSGFGIGKNIEDFDKDRNARH